MKSKENTLTVFLPSHPILHLLRICVNSWPETSKHRLCNESEGKDKGVFRIGRGVSKEKFCGPSLNV